MPFACNIDRRGKRVRAVSGTVFLIIAFAATVLTWVPMWWEWTLFAVLAAIGAFQLFEATIGWCAVRAWAFARLSERANIACKTKKERSACSR